ncbi:MAG: GNAT family N-acetyltransferase [Candidatus Woesearchaeota archaeon]
MIRKAHSEDLKKILKINEALNISSYTPWQDENYVRENIDNYYVYEEERNVLGAMGFFKHNSFGEIETLAVTEEARFKKIGSNLINHAIELTQNEKLSLLMVKSAVEYGVYEFYIKNRFELEKEENETYIFSRII